LPLVSCTGDHDAAVLGPTLLDASMVAGATYGLSGLASGGWTVEVELTPAGRQIVTAMAPKNVNVPLAMLYDGQLVTWLLVSEKLAGALDFQSDTEDDARRMATIINNG
jgi:preprotein translocase subunit SecD